MKRIALVTLVVLSLSYIDACKPAVTPTPPPLTGPGWTSVKCPTGVECWRTINMNPYEPEVVILRMSNDEYGHNFAGKEAAYLYGSYQIISKPPNGTVHPNSEPCTAASGVPCTPTSPWTVIVTHTPNSTLAYVAFQHQ
jgi:hypothetical protein